MATFKFVCLADNYSLVADDFENACIAALIVGGGKCGLEEEGGDRKMPVFLFGGSEDWIFQTFGKTIEDFFAILSNDPERMLEVADVLDSFVIGNRADYDQGLALADTPEKQKAYREEWHDRKRTSMSDYGAYAWHYAGALREKAQKMQALAERIQETVRSALDRFINQQNTPSMVEAVRAQVVDQLEALKREGLLPSVDLSPDYVGQSPDDPNALQIRWTDPAKIEEFRRVGVEVW